jgi:very-short-patch-repair endonuclease
MRAADHRSESLGHAPDCSDRLLDRRIRHPSCNELQVIAMRQCCVESKDGKRSPLRVRALRTEAVLWRELRGRQMLGYEFDRKYSIERHHVDFYCPALRLAVDVARIVTNARMLRNERRRVNQLFRLGVRVLRFTDDEVMHNLDGVVACIRRWVRNQPEQWGSRAAPHRVLASAELASSAAVTMVRRVSRRARAHAD